MTDDSVDYKTAFKALPDVTALLTPDLVILDVNDACLEATGKPREDLVGRSAFDALPDRIDRDMPPLAKSVQKIMSGEPEDIYLERYDIEDPGKPGVFEERYWIVANRPIIDEHGQVTMIEFRAQEATPVIAQYWAIRAEQG